MVNACGGSPADAFAARDPASSSCTTRPNIHAFDVEGTPAALTFLSRSQLAFTSTKRASNATHSSAKSLSAKSPASGRSSSNKKKNERKSPLGARVKPLAKARLTQNKNPGKSDD